LSHVDPFDAGALRDPYPFYRSVRARGAAVYAPDRDIWLVAGYQQAQFERAGEAARTPNQAVRKFSSLPVRLVAG
jgi:hypothetical protein